VRVTGVLKNEDVSMIAPRGDLGFPDIIIIFLTLTSSMSLDFRKSLLDDLFYIAERFCSIALSLSRSLAPAPSFAAVQETSVR
jgi:hypothetical protein